MATHSERDGAWRRFPWRLLGWGTAGLLLILPLVAMQFTREVNWTASDFVFAAVMFGSVGLGLELAVRKGNRAFTAACAIALAASFLSVWITGAVGIIGSEREDANILFLAVILVALLGSILALFRPRGMAWAMAAAALAEVSVPFVALIVWPEAKLAILSPEVPMSVFFLTGMWLTAASLFRKAAG
jgi:hypothetical protein